MKRVATILSLVMLSSCVGSSLQNMLGEHFAERESKKILYIPDSYDAIETIVDSAMLSAHNDPEILGYATEIAELYDDGNIFNLRNTYTKIEALESKIRERASEIEEGRFFGWEIRHRFRAEDNNGKVDIVDILYICDKQFKECYSSVILNRDNACGYNNLKDIIDNAIANVGDYNIDTSLLEELGESATEVFNELEEGSKEVVDNITRGATKVIKEIKKEAVTEEIEVAIEDIVNIGSEIKEQAKVLYDDIKDEATTILNEEASQRDDTSLDYSDSYGNDNRNTNTIDTNTLIELNNL